MNYSIQDIAVGLCKTLLLLVFVEIVTTAFLPAIGIKEFKPAFSVLIVLFLAFKIETPLLPFLILIIQYVHSGFSIEGWATGTFTGVLVSISVRYVKDMLNFTSAASTMIVVQVFQIIWFIFISIMLSMKQGDFSGFLGYIGGNIPESIFLSLISHHFFKLLDNFWKVNQRSTGMAL
jgi:hypothetical protein